MNRLEEIRQRAEAAKAQKEKGDSITAACIAWSIVTNDIPYLLSEVDRLTAQANGTDLFYEDKLAEQTANNAGLTAEVDRLNSALTAEKSKYKELQRYNVDCTKEAASLLCENSDLRKTLAALTARAEAAEAERDAAIQAIEKVGTDFCNTVGCYCCAHRKGCLDGDDGPFEYDPEWRGPQVRKGDAE